MTQEMKLSTQEQLIAEALANRSVARRRVLSDEHAEPQNVANLLCTAAARALALVESDDVSDHLAANVIEAIAYADHALVLMQVQKERADMLEKEYQKLLDKAEKSAPQNECGPGPIIHPDQWTKEDLERMGANPDDPVPSKLSQETIDAGEYLEDQAFNELDQELNHKG
ncbi:TPA: hypothetical protein P0E30_003736 [Vibrio harveyi]|nr:hypothetical protein [Vibrio harveyi]